MWFSFEAAKIQKWGCGTWFFRLSFKGPGHTRRRPMGCNLVFFSKKAIRL